MSGKIKFEDTKKGFGVVKNKFSFVFQKFKQIQISKLFYSIVFRENQLDRRGTIKSTNFNDIAEHLFKKGKKYITFNWVDIDPLQFAYKIPGNLLRLNSTIFMLFISLRFLFKISKFLSFISKSLSKEKNKKKSNYKTI
jgi:hypothetical protein